MLIGKGGYSDVWNGPRKDRVIEKKYWSKKFVQRLTTESLPEIYKGQKVRSLFDKNNTMSSPLITIYERPNRMFSEIRPYRDDNVKDLMAENIKKNNVPLFCSILVNLKDIMKGLIVIHKDGWVHHDIKTVNMLYNRDPFRLFLIDWATSVRFSDVYSDTYSPWFSADNTNHPPEYKSYAHFKYNYPFKKDDFATDYADNTYIISLLKIQPHYMRLLNEANDELQRAFKTRGPSFLKKIAPKVDVFAMGVAISRIYLTIAYAELYKTRVGKDLVYVLKNMINPNPLKRWTMRRSLKTLSPLIPQVCAFAKRSTIDTADVSKTGTKSISTKSSSRSSPK